MATCCIMMCLCITQSETMPMYPLLCTASCSSLRSMTCLSRSIGLLQPFFADRFLWVSAKAVYLTSPTICLNRLWLDYLYSFRFFLCFHPLSLQTKTNQMHCTHKTNKRVVQLIPKSSIYCTRWPLPCVNFHFCVLSYCQGFSIALDKLH